MKREENNFGYFLGLILALLSWILGGVAGLYIQFPELDQFPLIRDLGGHKLITIILLATLPGYVFFWIFQRFNHPTCVGIALALGYILGGIMGISFGVAIPWALGYATGLETMPLTIMMGLSGFGMGTTTMNAVARRTAPAATAARRPGYQRRPGQQARPHRPPGRAQAQGDRSREGLREGRRGDAQHQQEPLRAPQGVPRGSG